MPSGPKKIPKIEPLEKHFRYLCKMVAETSWLPNPETVHSLRCAIFPTCRARKHHPRVTPIMEGGKKVGMYDDNTTPTWALLWARGIVDSNRKGWGFAHVWQVSDDRRYYTHLANLLMIPESFMALTDKNGPLTTYLRWHAWKVYNWKPADEATPKEPIDYQDITWRYLEKCNDPKRSIEQRLAKLDNERVRFLRELPMESLCGE